MRTLASDLDGTIIFGDEVHADDVRALVRWRQEGNLVIASTARSVARAHAGLALLEEASGTGAPVFDYAVCSTGGTVIDAHGSLLRNLLIPAQAVRAVHDALVDRDDVSVNALSVTGSYVIHDPLRFNEERERRGHRFTPMSIDEVDDVEVSSMSVKVVSEERAASLAPVLADALAGRAEVSRSAGFVDVVPAGASKARGLRWLLGRLRARGVATGELVAVGDSHNDVPMFELADRAWAMDGAVDEVAARADGRTASVGALLDRLLAEARA